MYRSVIIEGSTTPAVGVLARGERKTVQLTPRVQRLINRGYVVVVSLLDLPDIRDSASVTVYVPLSDDNDDNDDDEDLDDYDDDEDDGTSS